MYEPCGEFSCPTRLMPLKPGPHVIQIIRKLLIGRLWSVFSLIFRRSIHTIYPQHNQLCTLHPKRRLYMEEKRIIVAPEIISPAHFPQSPTVLDITTIGSYTVPLNSTNYHFVYSHTHSSRRPQKRAIPLFQPSFQSRSWILHYHRALSAYHFSILYACGSLNLIDSRDSKP